MMVGFWKRWYVIYHDLSEATFGITPCRLSFRTVMEAFRAKSSERRMSPSFLIGSKQLEGQY